MKIRALLAFFALAFPAYGQVSAPVAPSITNINGIVSQSAGGTSQSPAQLQRWKSCEASVRAGVGGCTVLLAGDSTTTGENAATVFFPQGRSYWLASRLNNVTTDNLPVDQMGVCGFGGSRFTKDPRIAISGSPAVTYSGNSLGGPIAALGSGSVITYTPGVAFNSVRVIIYSGSASVQITGGSTSTLTTAANALGTITATTATAAASNSITITGTATVYVECILPTNTSINNGAGIHIVNAGFWNALIVGSGTAASNTNGIASTTAVYGALAVLTYLAPQVTELQPGINDWNTGSTPLATYIAGVQSFGTAAAAVGDFILNEDVPDNFGNTLQASYNPAMQVLAAQNNWPFFDTWTAWGGTSAGGAAGYTLQNALGNMSDTLHPNTQGYAKEGAAEAVWLLSQ